MRFQICGQIDPIDIEAQGFQPFSECLCTAHKQAVVCDGRTAKRQKWPTHHKG